MPSPLNQPKRSDAWRWLALSVVPLAATLLHAFTFIDLLKTKTWPEVQATVVSSSVKASCTKGPQYIASVRLSYSMRGTSYTSESDSFSHSDCTSFEEASSMASRYVPGSSVAARVNPADLSQSTFATPEFSLQSKLSVGFFVSLFLVCIGLAARAYRGAA